MWCGKHIFIACALISALALAPGIAEREVHSATIGTGVGMYIPVGSAGDIYDTAYSLNTTVDLDLLSNTQIIFLANYYEVMGQNLGYNIEVHADFNIIHDLDFRFLVNHFAMIGENDGVRYRMDGTGGGVMIIFAPTISIFSPYIGVGYGLHTIDHGPVRNQKFSAGHGPIVELGADLQILAMSIGAHFAYMGNFVDGVDLSGISAVLLLIFSF